MPKNSLTILKEMHYSNLSNFRYDGYVKEIHFGKDDDVKSYSLQYGSGKIMFQYISIHDVITIIIYKDKNDTHHSFSKVIDGVSYKERKEKMDKIFQIILDGVYDGCDVSVIIPAIDKI